jgi:hypothetical protein
VGTSREGRRREVGAYRTHQEVHLGTVPVHQGRESHLADQSGSGMGLQGHQGRRKEDSHRAGTDHEEGSLAAVADAAGLAAGHLDVAATVVPIAHAVLAKSS